MLGGWSLTNLPACVATAPSIQFREPGYPTYRNLLFLTDLLTNRIAQINTNHHKHTQPTVWNGHATHFKIQFSRFRNCPAEAEAVRRSGLFLGTAILQGVFLGPVLMSLANSLLTAGLTATLWCQYAFKASNGHDRLATMSIAATGRAVAGPSPGRLGSASSNYPDM